MLMLISIFFALPGGPEVSSYRIINVSYYNVIKSVDLVRFFSSNQSVKMPILSAGLLWIWICT